MSIELFKHNKETYDNLIKMFSIGTKRVGVVQPTGTGKSFLFLKWIEDNREDKFIILSPSVEIFTQLKEYSDSCGSPRLLENCWMITYQTLLYKTDEELENIRGDKIIIDEFHRVGADQWGDRVEKILTANPDAQIFGTTATPVRYLDGSRNMADQLFDGNLARYMTLGEAVAENILPEPVYVPVWYDITGKMEKYQQDIGTIADISRRYMLEEKLKDLREILYHSYGAADVFKKYMPDNHGKYIVFCSSFEHLQDMQDKLTGWLAGVNKNIHIYVSISRDYDRDDQLNKFKQDNSTDAIKLLFTIDRLNEGVHVKGIDGVIMLRPTISPIIYLQQMGRALSAGNKQPVIFDMVNNYRNVQVFTEQSEYINIFVNEYDSAFSDSEAEETGNRSYKMFEQMTRFNQLFESLENILYIDNETRWQHTFELVKEYMEISGQSPITGTVYNNVNIGEWLSVQNRNYRKGTLTQSREEKLRQLGLVLGDRTELRWLEYFAALQEYVAQKGQLPSDKVEYKGYKIGHWLTNQKSSHNKGWMTRAHKEKLESLGVQFVDTLEQRWQANFSILQQYVEQNNTVPDKSTVYHGVRIGQWLVNQLQKLKKGKLSQERKAQLESIGVRLTGAFDEQWLANFNVLAECINNFGSVPPTLTEYNGVNPARWLKYQKQLFREGKLSEHRKEKLESIGIVFTR